MADLIERRDALNMHFSHGINNDGVLYVPFREVMDNLKALPSEQTTQNNRVNSDIALDLIERQAAIDALHTKIREVNEGLWELEGCQGYCDMVASIGTVLDDVPSVQPEKRTDERTETHGVCLDAISRQAAIDAVQGIGRIATLPDNDAVIRMSAVEYVLFNLPSEQTTHYGRT